jgi:hypothetical protein
MKEIYSKKDLQLMESCLDGKYKILSHVDQYFIQEEWVDEFNVLDSTGTEKNILVNFDGDVLFTT